MQEKQTETKQSSKPSGSKRRKCKRIIGFIISCNAGVALVTVMVIIFVMKLGAPVRCYASDSLDLNLDECAPANTGEMVAGVLDGHCAANITLGDQMNAGTQFNANEHSRWLFNTMPTSYTRNATFTLEFKTSTPDGILFYASHENDFMALYIKSGLIWYAFRIGSEKKAVFRTKPSYNDGNWHEVSFARGSRTGVLVVDEVKTNGTAPGHSSSLRLQPPFFVGGVGPSVHTGDHLPPGLPPFNGCIRNPRLNNHLFGEPDSDIYTRPCTDSVQQSAVLTDAPGYITLTDNFITPRDFVISLEILPITNSGVLVSVYNPENGEYLVIQLKDGDVMSNFNVGEGRDEFVFIGKGSTPYDICDGTWRHITVDQHVVIAGYPTDGAIGLAQIDTNNPLYIGGVPSLHPGINTDEKFAGCIRNLKINHKSYSLASSIGTDGVIRDNCPLKTLN